MMIRSPALNAFRNNSFNSARIACFFDFKTTTRLAKNFSRTSNVRTAVTPQVIPRLRDSYFSANSLLEQARAISRRGNAASTINHNSTIASDAESSKIVRNTSEQTNPSSSTTKDLLPHRRRQAARRAAAQADLVMPQNASTIFTEKAAAQAPSNSLRRLLPVLLSLTKPRLSVLVVLSAMASYSLYPVPELLSPSASSTPSLSPLTLLFLTTGTALAAASANTFNMLFEFKWDALMSRTKNRPLVRGLISPRGSAIFAILSGTIGVAALYYGVNPTVSFLGALNIALYAGVYTPLKRISVLNTWVGALVGGIPPLMGWAAAAGQSATGDGSWRDLLLGEPNVGGWILSALLVAWQFTHFMPLSWSIREEYKNAGYKMLAWVNPARNGRVALRYSFLFFPICIGLCYTGITEWTFAVVSTPANAWLCKEAVRFWYLEGASGSAKGLFWATVWHLPVLMILAMVEKKGLWQRLWRGIMGFADEEEDQEWVDAEEKNARKAVLVSR